MPSTSTIAPLILAALIAAASATTAEARRQPPEASSPRMDALIKCRTIADPVARLACFDTNIAPLETAISKKEVFIVDRKKAEDADRSLFGFSSPAIGKMFGFGQLDSIASTLSTSGYNRDGGVTITLADGSRWSQTDDKQMFGTLKKGTRVKVKRGLMGSYIVEIDGQVGFKAVRIG